MPIPGLSFIDFLLERITLTSRTRVLLGSGGFVALVIVLRFILAKRAPPKYLSDLAHLENKEYDVIIVGGGTAGCALAARLSEDPSIKVLLLEAGQSGTALPQSRTPALFSRLFKTKHVLQMRTEPQSHANNRTQFWPRGIRLVHLLDIAPSYALQRVAKLLGGCSSINAQMAQYGAPEDFDQWAQLMDDDSWSWKNFSQYFTKFERYQPHPDYPLVDTTVRGSSGPVRIGYFNTVSEPSKAFIQACTNVGIPFTPDFNVASGTLGVSRISKVLSIRRSRRLSDLHKVTYIDDKKRRVSSESAYLTEDVLARKNLTVAINAQVARILMPTLSGNDHPHAHYPNSRRKVSRKDARKEQRLSRKQHKAEYFSASHSQSKRRAEQNHEESPQRKKPKLDEPLSRPAPTLSSEPSQPALKQKKTSPSKSLPKPIAAPRIPDPRRDEDDANIAYLEDKLGYSKGKRKKHVEDDGLDGNCLYIHVYADLLDFADTLVDLQPQNHDNELEELEEADTSDESVYESDNANESEEEEEWLGLGEDEENESFQAVLDPPQPSSTIEENASRYVPPHLRNKAPTDEQPSEAMLRLSRQLKGLLNRMSEQNMGTILDSVEDIYRDNRRNAANFVQNVVASYERHLATASVDTGEGGGKECSNLIVLLSELYNFQVISSILVFDIIRGLLDAGLSELAVELLLKIVRNSGQQLRHDDPLALKDIVEIVQRKVSELGEVLSSRTRFMIETLTNLKNNKIKRIGTQNQGAESVERMKKFLTGLGKKRTLLAHEPLRVSLGDLHSAETKGKWWLVGAAWAGDPLVDRQVEVKNTDTQTMEATKPANDLIKLARKQGMNTDIRRSIFVVLMSSDDYVDACERLSQLNLTQIQQREIEKTYNPYYTLVCQQLCRTSHSYKITLQFTLWDFLRDLGETSVGGTELIKSLGDDSGFDVKNISLSRSRNVARAYGWWIAKDCVTLAILKPIDFTSLQVATTDFLREMLLQVFVCSQRTSPMITSSLNDVPSTRNRGVIEEIFIKATRIQALAMGLTYFLSEAFRDTSKDGEEMGKFIKWANGLAKDTLRTGADIIPTL
ncbi:hypothetical protein H0H93_011028 [Arthromyces matolae]|nr:hypothetical protein H0H93_011028 [Arthromyces matolae]